MLSPALSVEPQISPLAAVGLKRSSHLSLPVVSSMHCATPSILQRKICPLLMTPLLMRFFFSFCTYHSFWFDKSPLPPALMATVLPPKPPAPTMTPSPAMADV